MPTKEALNGIEEVKNTIDGQFQVINNVYTEGGNVTIERLGTAMDNKMKEVELLKNVIEHLNDIINVKDAQIKLMLDTLTDNKEEIEQLKNEVLKKG